MEVSLPDGSRRELPDGATGADLAAAIGPGLARAALAVRVGSDVRDLAAPLPSDGGGPVAIVTSRDPESLELLRHDTAHVLAAAILELHPGTRISIGPPIEDGFYYDFEFPEGVTVSDADFGEIEAAMQRHVKADEAFVREDVSSAQARERFVTEDQPYKVELIDDLGEERVSLYTNGPFTDLCRGPHAPSTKRIKAFKLLSVAGAYWRGDSERTMLTRIYGTAFHSKEDLAAHLERLEQARLRDHRRLGRELDLVRFSDVSPGSAFWLPRGTALYNTLVALSREMGGERGFTEVQTPQLYDAELWRTSGHWGKYRENMFVTESEDRSLGVKPMNCPGHAHLYSLQRFSHRDLPVRYAEPGQLHRDEPSGTLHGLLRVRRFVQDDAHVFCTDDQLPEEIDLALEQCFETYRLFGFEPEVELSTRPDDRMGTDAMWDEAEGALQRALEAREITYRVNEGDGAFYGPKIDLHVTDSLGRSWQLGTVQVDYSMPERFDLRYTGADNAEHRPVMIHTARMGSFERFIGILIEHYAGEFPLWLAPDQAVVLPVADRFNPYGAGVVERLRAAGLRASLDDRSESVGRKIRETELRKVPYMLVVGEREVESGGAALRRHGEGDLGTFSVDEVAERLLVEVAERRYSSRR